jgi:ATP-binding cassette, subfamily B, bacterial
VLGAVIMTVINTAADVAPELLLGVAVDIVVRG